MPQSLSKNYIHIVFSTKNRAPLIYPPFEAELHSYMAGTCKNLHCYPVAVGGYVDHVHILCVLSRKIALMKLLEDLKSESSKWLKTKDESLQSFFWQDGYGAFSVSPGHVEALITYIKKQHEHHNDKSFKDEYLGLLKRYDVPYDERYLWD